MKALTFGVICRTLCLAARNNGKSGGVEREYFRDKEIKMIGGGFMDVMIEHNHLVAILELGKPAAHPASRPIVVMPVESIDAPETEPISQIFRHFVHERIPRAERRSQELFFA